MKLIRTATMVVLRIVAGAACLFVGQSVMGQTPRSERHPLPEVAAAAFVINRHAPTLRVAVEEKRYFAIGADRSATTSLPDSVREALPISLGIRAIKKEDLESCSGRYTCSYRDLDASIMLGSLEEGRASASLLVRLSVETRPGKVKGRDISIYRVELVRSGDSWQAKYAMLEGVGR